ncbi:MAG: TonB-dependent receptor [Bacteroidetes bacterium]|nr:MAG: TonB-dependent receptor [Bacteroidota bacterium]
MIKGINVGVCVLCFAAAAAQPDSLVTRYDSSAVVITAFEQNRTLMNAAAGVSVVNIGQLEANTKTSLVQQINTVAGARMEERSPGSYRLSLRGSSLRAPFGVRNVKIYYEGIPLTDPGGNTYLNGLAVNNFSAVEVLKGPGGSLYGAGTGGVLLAKAWQRRGFAPMASVEFLAGSFGLNNAQATVQFGDSLRQQVFQMSHTGSNGYRQQSAMRRTNLAWHTLLGAGTKYSLQMMAMHAALWYETPGALTQAELAANPRAARPAAGGFPSAVQAQAQIKQSNTMLGMVFLGKMGSHWQNTTMAYGSISHIKNAAIRNYEQRREPHLGGRSTFTYQLQKPNTTLYWVSGAEAQMGFFNTRVFRNLNGSPDTLLTNDDIDLVSGFFFSQLQWQWRQQWFVSAGASYNTSSTTITRTNRLPLKEQSTSLTPTVSPRATVVYRINAQLSASAIFSRGFSPPTLGELLPSTGVISTGLNAETATNYELGVKWQLWNNSLRIEANAFRFGLENALVQRRDAAGADFFVNAGGTRQSGIETSVFYNTRFAPGSFLNRLQGSVAHAYSHFRYGIFVQGSNNHSGKRLPGTPQHTLAAALEAQLLRHATVQLNYYAASRVYLNDANTATDGAYHVLAAKLGWQIGLPRQMAVELFAGAENLANVRYSLGHDINAAAGRFFNAAPPRNYFVGCKLFWQQKKVPAI